VSDNITPVKVTILNNDYLIGCKEDEKEEVQVEVTNPVFVDTEGERLRV